MNRVDFHTHTSASDGIKTPSELIDLAIENGLVVMAVTDHDTVDGIDEALDYAEERGFDLIPGIEFSIDHDRGSFHLIGLNIDHTEPELQGAIKVLAEHRDTRAARIVEDLNNHGIGITYDEVVQEAGSGSVGRPHIARVLVRHGLGESVRDIFDNFLVKGTPGYVKKYKIGIDHAIMVIKKAGGLPLIAHPVSLDFGSFDEFESLLVDMVQRGVRGFEVYAPMHTEDQVSLFLEIARTHDLIISGGSDYHGDKNEKLGYYTDERPIPFSVYEELKPNIS